MPPKATSGGNVDKAGRKPGTFTKGDPRINRTIPGPGRTPDAFKAMCAELASSKEVEQNVRLILQDPDHPLYLGALKWATENGYGKPDQKVEVGVAGLADILTAAKAIEPHD